MPVSASRGLSAKDVTGHAHNDRCIKREEKLKHGRRLSAHWFLRQPEQPRVNLRGKAHLSRPQKGYRPGS